MESSPLPKWLSIAFVAIALVGFGDSAFLTAEHFRGVVPPCSVVVGCEKVLTSSYALILGIPVALMGVLFYGVILVLMLSYFDSGSNRAVALASWVAVGGFAGTLYFLFLQAFVIRAFCQYCLLSAATSTILFIFGVITLRRPHNLQAHVT